MARLAGKVHGVVVQMAMLALSFAFAARDRELDVNGGVVAFLIFDFGFGQRGLRAGAPENRLLRLINEILFNEDGEGAQNFGFVFGIHRQIWIFPIAENAEAFELLALKIDILAREGFGFLRTSSGESSRDSLTTLYSMGRPWQSQPGT